MVDMTIAEQDIEKAQRLNAIFSTMRTLRDEWQRLDRERVKLIQEAYPLTAKTTDLDPIDKRMTIIDGDIRELMRETEELNGAVALSSMVPKGETYTAVMEQRAQQRAAEREPTLPERLATLEREVAELKARG